MWVWGGGAGPGRSGAGPELAGAGSRGVPQGPLPQERGRWREPSGGERAKGRRMGSPNLRAARSAAPPVPSVLRPEAPPLGAGSWTESFSCVVLFPLL